MATLSPAEQRLVRRLTTPARVQGYLNGLTYNDESGGKTLRSFREVVRRCSAHCLEAALAAAVILERHGYPPLVLSFESIDKLEHVIFVYRRRGRWGSIARSRDPGLHGRKPVFRTARDLARSYFEPYVDLTGGITAYAVVDLNREMGSYDWRFSPRNVWKVEQMLIDYPHHQLPYNRARAERWRAWYRAFRARYPDRKPVCYPGRDRWSALPPSTPGRATRCACGTPGERAGAQSRSKSRVGLVTGSCRACRRASSKRRDSASPRVFSDSTDCWNTASRRCRSWSTNCAAWSRSGRSSRTGSRCDTMRFRFLSTTSVEPQHGQVSSISDFSFATMSPLDPRAARADRFYLRRPSPQTRRTFDPPGPVAFTSTPRMG